MTDRTKIRLIATDALAFAFHSVWQIFSGYDVRWKSAEIDGSYDRAQIWKIVGSFRWDCLRWNWGKSRLEIDIQNLGFDFLTSKWQEENRRAAETALLLVGQYPEEEVDFVANLVHEAWLNRNPWEKGSEQGLSYKELNPLNKSKDQMHVVLAQQAVDVFSL